MYSIKRVSVSDNRISKWANGILVIIFSLYSVVFIYPLLLIVSVSFSDNAMLRDYGYKLIPKAFDTSGYQYIFSTISSIGSAYLITIFVTIAGTALNVMMSAMYAYSLSRPEFAYRRGFTIFLLVTMLFSGGLVPWYIVCTRVLHLKDTVLALILPMAFSAWYVIVLRTFIKNNIPESLVESARIEGCSEHGIFWRIVLPLTKAGIVTIAFMVALSYWNDWWNPLMLISNEKMNNLQYLLYRVLNQIQYLSSISNNNAASSLVAMNTSKGFPAESARMALCVISIGPIIMVYPFFQRYFVRGLTIGAVKG
jgi:putative aldouronate transport system permease protein